MLSQHVEFLYSVFSNRYMSATRGVKIKGWFKTTKQRLAVKRCCTWRDVVVAAENGPSSYAEGIRLKVSLNLILKQRPSDHESSVEKKKRTSRIQ